MSAACCIVYASIDDFESAGVPAAAVAGKSLKAQQAALMRASRMADTFLRNRYHLPMCCPVDPALTQWVCWIAAYLLMSNRGFNPNPGQPDMLIKLNYDDAINNLRRVANNQQQLCVAQAQAASEQPQVATSPSRGFSGPDGNALPFVGPNTWGN